MILAYSGGMDSSGLLTFLLHRIKPRNVKLLTVQYGSLHNAREREAAGEVIAYLQNKHRKTFAWEVFSYPETWFMGSGSALLGEADMPERDYDVEGPNATEVPFRNAHIISLMATQALIHDRTTIYIAVHKSDSENWAYPDCSKPFMEGMKQAVEVGTYGRVELHTPFIEWEKWEIVKAVAEIDPMPLHLSYSCYVGGKYHCGKCPTCLERRKAFRIAGVEDKTIYGGTK